ncbi:MAG TPA: NAD(P)-binding domain-containing protein [Thermodesulfobacteriota bacterium]|nr:NAD(P)-binding domain-containing protein [Thermodesulfobacteriota bacterium]
MTFYVSIAILAIVMGIYLSKKKKKYKKTDKKITKAVEYGQHEPVSIHPNIDKAKCIGSGACIKACPEKDIIGISGGKGKLINASHCVGHGACAAACPVGAISLVFGTETRGVDIPYVTPNFETNIKGVFIVGELGGIGLIKNAVTQGKQAVEYIYCLSKDNRASKKNMHDLIIVGAGPAGFGASLAALKNKLKFLTIDQEDIGGTVLQYPRHKIVMTSPVELPGYGKVKLRETTKEALLELWADVINKTGLKVNSKEKMTGLVRDSECFKVTTSKGEYLTKHIVLAIGRRGTPRKLGVPGEGLSKVTYRLLDPEQHKNQHILVVGGGDSAVEAAMAIAAQPGNTVLLSYRGESFSRIKPMNKVRLDEALAKKSLKVALNSNVKEITEKDVSIAFGTEVKKVPNDYVYIFAGGELPNEFLKSIGIQIEKKFGTA